VTVYYSSASRSLRELVQRAYLVDISSTSLNKETFVLRVFFKLVRTAKEPATRARRERSIRTNKQVSGRVGLGLASSFCYLRTEGSSRGEVAAVTLAYIEG
jgi:hypothetical protein